MSKIFFILLLFFALSFSVITIPTTYAADGICGSANGQTFPTAPTTNLCSAGSASGVTGNGPWNWNCIGSDNPNCTEGESKTCTTSDSCAGKQYCTGGNWGACTKNDANCGSNDYCYKGQWCDGDTGSCVDKCSECPCPTDKPTCGGDGKCINTSNTCTASQIKLTDGTCVSNCDDGTNVNQCARGSVGYQCIGVPADKPTKVELVPACQVCGCPGTKDCNSDGTCVQRSDIPESFNWADKGVLTSVKNQGDCGSCWAFAGVAAVEAMYNIEHKTTGDSLDLSEQELLSCSNAGSCKGGGIESGLDYIQKKGIGTESCFRYQVNSSAECVQCSERHGFGQVRSVDKDLYKFIMESGPVPISIDIGEPNLHAVLMIGWSREGNIYIKNSWGGGDNQFYAPINYFQFKGSSWQPTGTY